MEKDLKTSFKDLKYVLLVLVGLVTLFFISEAVNYLSNPASLSSSTFDTYFIKRAILKAKQGNLSASLSNLSLASRINTYGEYDLYRDLLPADFSEKVSIPDDPILETSFLNYISNLTDADSTNTEDQGLGMIYYNLALASYKNNHPELVPKLLKIASNNNPEFASFHAELINYFFSKGMTDDVNREMDYCLKFEGAKILCGQYRDDSIRLNIPKDVGYLRLNIEIFSLFSYFYWAFNGLCLLSGTRLRNCIFVFRKSHSPSFFHKLSQPPG